ncbi:hypothetical protein GOP47_0000969 [Adiantum capillus-veneris]|uniref:Uncharacterized protein n=1 Tax=Adiantum capillus-veneris TaxID=13818 RepID=A0A9D4VEY1_ADICA|nr:hypothetical protein GOP47_0000969 [Adiantum capillus-veneris]
MASWAVLGVPTAACGEGGGHRPEKSRRPASIGALSQVQAVFFWQRWRRLVRHLRQEMSPPASYRSLP